MAEQDWFGQFEQVGATPDDPWRGAKPYQGPSDAIEADPLLDPLSLIGLLFGGPAAKAAPALKLAGRAGKAVGRATKSGARRAAPAVAKHGGMALGASVGGTLAGPGGAALGGMIGRQAISPAMLAKLLGTMSRQPGTQAPNIAETLGNSVNWIR